MRGVTGRPGPRLYNHATGQFGDNAVEPSMPLQIAESPLLANSAPPGPVSDRALSNYVWKVETLEYYGETCSSESHPPVPAAAIPPTDRAVISKTRTLPLIATRLAIGARGVVGGGESRGLPTIRRPPRRICLIINSGYDATKLGSSPASIQREAIPTAAPEIPPPIAPAERLLNIARHLRANQVIRPTTSTPKLAKAKRRTATRHLSKLSTSISPMRKRRPGWAPIPAARSTNARKLNLPITPPYRNKWTRLPMGPAQGMNIPGEIPTSNSLATRCLESSFSGDGLRDGIRQCDKRISGAVGRVKKLSLRRNDLHRHGPQSRGSVCRDRNWPRRRRRQNPPHTPPTEVPYR